VIKLTDENLKRTSFIRERNRFEIQGLVESVLGGLAYLADTQVADSTDYNPKNHNFFIYSDAISKNGSQISGRLRNFTGKWIIKERHIEGSWPGTVRFLPAEGSGLLKPFFTATDYNVCTTIGTAYSLLFFDDSSLPHERRFVSTMLDKAYQAVNQFKREGAFNFWVTQTRSNISYPYSGPINIPLSIIDLRNSINNCTRLLGLDSFYESDVLMHWIKRVYNKNENKHGSISLFNIPNDSDNTSMAVGFMLKYKQLNQRVSDVDLSPLDLFPLFRDLDRKLTDRCNICLGRETGSFLTWLKDENEYVFSAPELGIIPLSVNNVDIVINANVLFALSLAGKSNLPGFAEATKLLSRVIEEKTWSKASLYYPEKMFFPYALSRAIRDAGLNSSDICRALPILVKSILEEQITHMKNNLNQVGASSGINVESTYLATALGLVTLLNIGNSVAKEIGMLKAYDDVIENGIQFLITSRNPDKVNNRDKSPLLSGIRPDYWKSGVLYSSSVQSLSHWYSNPHTTSLTIEALTKYLLNYDLISESGYSPQLCIIDDNGKLNLRLKKDFY